MKQAETAVAPRFAAGLGEWAGIVGPIGFVAVFLLEGAVRSDYDPARHFVSLLALTDRGWVQVANFLIGGALIAGFGLGLRPAWTGRGRWVPPLIALTGLALVWCGVFTSDPALGYPPGTAPGIPTSASLVGGLHYLGAFVVFFGLAVGIFLSARYGPNRAIRAWAIYSLASGVVLLGGWIAGFLVVGPSGIVETAGLWQRIAVVAGWQWLVAVAVLQRSTRRAAPPPDGG